TRYTNSLRRLTFAALVWKLRQFVDVSPIVLFVVLIVLAGAWAFIKIADEVGENETQHFDERILRSLRRPDNPQIPRGPYWLPEVVRDLTALGSHTVLLLAVCATLGYLLIVHKHAAFALVL